MKHDFEIKEKLPVEFKKKWVEALRSGEYKQGKEQLYDSEGHYCCLGVAAKICGNDMNNLIGECGFVPFDAKGVPDLLKNNEDMEEGDVPEFLAIENDTEASFIEIADWIDKNL